MTYQRKPYTWESAAAPLRAASVPILAVSVPDRLRRARREWLGFVPVDSDGLSGSVVVAARGQRTFVNVHPAELFRRILDTRARGVILVHNHPSGKTDPSTHDYWLTREVRETCKTMGIKVLGHAIVTRNDTHFFDKGAFNDT